MIDAPLGLYAPGAAALSYGRCVLTGARLGLYASGAAALSGDELDSMDISELCRIIGQVGVFYRTTPRHKLKIVKVSRTLVLTFVSSSFLLFFRLFFWLCDS